MSIGRRLIDLARAELNSLLDRAAGDQDGGDDGDDRFRGRGGEHDDDGYGGEPLGRLSDKELEEELERRRQARQEAERAAHGPQAGEASSSGASGRRRPEFRRGTAETDEVPIRRAYATLEVPPGSDFEAVRRSYRALMRKYHPDLHTSTPEKQKAANELTQKLTDAYKLLEKRLRK